MVVLLVYEILSIFEFFFSLNNSVKRQGIRKERKLFCYFWAADFIFQGIFRLCLEDSGNVDILQ